MRASWSPMVLLLCACSKEPSRLEIHAEPSASVVVSAPPPSAPVALAIDAGGVRAGDTLLATFGDDRAKGADESQKRSGPNDLFLVPVGAWVARERSEGRLGPALTLVVQRETPYRALLEVLFTAAQSEVSAFDLREATLTGRLVHTEPPRASAPLTPEELERLQESPPLDLHVLVTQDGVALKAVFANVGPGCREASAGLAVPHLNGKLDLPALMVCVRSLKALKPAFAKENTMTLAASPAIAVGELFDVAIALHGSAEAPLFPVVYFGVSR